MKTGLFQRFSLARLGAPGSVSVQAEALAQLHRNALAAFTALISAYWIGPAWATAWFAVILLHEYFTVPTVTREKIVPHLKTDPAQARRWLIGVSGWGCCLYGMGWFPSFVTGAAGSGYFAAVCMACAMIHAVVYTRKDPLVFAAYLVPTVLFSTIGGFICYGFTLLPFVLMLISARLALSTIIGMRDRSALYDSIKDNKVRREAAERASAAKTEFLATMSHELRTPLNAVIGYAEIVQEDLESGSAQPEDVERIRKAARGLLAMIEDVLDYSQLEAGKISRHDSDTDLRALLESEAETARAKAALHANRIDVRCDFVGAIELDAEHLRRALRKLLSNACKFTANGVITLEARCDASTLTIAVADTGTGISPEARARLFRPFEQAESGKTRGHDGAGLGLAIVARLAALMGGTVSLDTQSSAGARFVLTLPVQQVASAPLARVA